MPTNEPLDQYARSEMRQWVRGMPDQTCMGLDRATIQLTFVRAQRRDSGMTGRRGHGDGGIDEPSPGHQRLRWLLKSADDGSM
jgi:hypothetical protein